MRYETIQKGNTLSNSTGSAAVPSLPSVEVNECFHVQISLSLNEPKTQEVKPVVSLFNSSTVC